MKKIFFKPISILFVILSLGLSSCGTDKKKDEKVVINYRIAENYLQNHYIIPLVKFPSLDSAKNYCNNFKLFNGDSLFIINLNNNYEVFLGKFNSNSEAGEKIFNYNLDDNKKIMLNGKSVFDSYRNIFIVGNYRTKAGIYKYDIIDKKMNIFWRSNRERVLSFLPSNSLENQYFITAERYGISGLFPFVKDANLYLIDSDHSNYKKIHSFGDGIQIYYVWENESTLKIHFISYDLTITSNINEEIFYFNEEGKLVLEEKIVYNLLNNEFPRVRISNNILTSNKHNYQAKVIEKEDSNRIVVYQGKNVRQIFFPNDKMINKIEWADSFLIYSIITRRKRNTDQLKDSQLILYNINNESSKELYSGEGRINFVIRNKHIYFDIGFDKDSKINIVDFNGNLVVEIKIPGGTGIFSIPKLPELK